MKLAIRFLPQITHSEGPQVILICFFKNWICSSIYCEHRCFTHLLIEAPVSNQKKVKKAG